MDNVDVFTHRIENISNRVSKNISATLFKSTVVHETFLFGFRRSLSSFYFVNALNENYLLNSCNFKLNHPIFRDFLIFVLSSIFRICFFKLSSVLKLLIKQAIPKDMFVFSGLSTCINAKYVYQI